MNENVDKHIENMVDKVMKNVTLEIPSFDFTAKVMSQVNLITQSQATVYEPLISKKGWIIIFGGLIAVVAYVLFFSQPQTKGWFSKINFSALNDYKISNVFSGIEPSRITTYALILLAIMLILQVSVLKNYFDKRIQG